MLNHGQPQETVAHGASALQERAAAQVEWLKLKRLRQETPSAEGVVCFVLSGGVIVNKSQGVMRSSPAVVRWDVEDLI